MSSMAPSPSHGIEVMAVAALDEIASDLIRANRFGVPPNFLTWVEAEATPLVERRARRWIRHSPSTARDHDAVRRKVHTWVMPYIAAHFSSLAAGMRHAGANEAVSPRRSASTWRPVYSIDLVLE